MQIGPIKFEFNGPGPNGVWYRNSNGIAQDITIPAVVVTVVAVFTLCCCLRVVF